MKKYIAPACEIVNLATTSCLLLGSPETGAIVVDPSKEVTEQLSNRYDNDMDWDEE